MPPPSFPSLASEEIKLSSLISPKEEMNLYKARVVYGIQGVEAIEYAPYKMKEIHSLINTDFLFGYFGESFSRLWHE